MRWYRNKGNRLHRYFTTVTTYKSHLWCSRKDGKWKSYNECRKDNHGCSSNSHQRVASLRAFRRYLKHHPEIPKGTHVRLISKYVNHDIDIKM